MIIFVSKLFEKNFCKFVSNMKLKTNCAMIFSTFELKLSFYKNSFLAVEVWFEYLQFCTGLGTEKETIEKIRNLFERALTAVGLHVMKGDLIWETYREFENFILNMVIIYM